MKEAERPMLDGTVEMDETYVGGRKRGIGARAAREAKEVVIGIRQRGGDVRFFHASDAHSSTLAFPQLSLRPRLSATSAVQFLPHQVAGIRAASKSNRRLKLLGGARRFSTCGTRCKRVIDDYANSSEHRAWCSHP
jgi:hypothetical protein